MRLSITVQRKSASFYLTNHHFQIHPRSARRRWAQPDRHHILRGIGVLRERGGASVWRPKHTGLLWHIWHGLLLSHEQNILKRTDFISHFPSLIRTVRYKYIRLVSSSPQQNNGKKLPSTGIRYAAARQSSWNPQTTRPAINPTYWRPNWQSSKVRPLFLCWARARKWSVKSTMAWKVGISYNDNQQLARSESLLHLQLTFILCAFHLMGKCILGVTFPFISVFQ